MEVTTGQRLDSFTPLLHITYFPHCTKLHAVVVVSQQSVYKITANMQSLSEKLQYKPKTIFYAIVMRLKRTLKSKS